MTPTPGTGQPSLPPKLPAKQHEAVLTPAQSPAQRPDPLVAGCDDLAYGKGEPWFSGRTLAALSLLCGRPCFVGGRRRAGPWIRRAAGTVATQAAIRMGSARGVPRSVGAWLKELEDQTCGSALGCPT